MRLTFPGKETQGGGLPHDIRHRSEHLRSSGWKVPDQSASAEIPQWRWRIWNQAPALG